MLINPRTGKPETKKHRWRRISNGIHSTLFDASATHYCLRCLVPVIKKGNQYFGFGTGKNRTQQVCGGM